ncbi:MAG: PilZ domain-containing protein [Deltaproteobacteria bacterium]|nr:PilZ domain-containing protein [Deltaproteobacteria bacterium]
MSKELRRSTRYDVEVSAEVYTPTAQYAASTRNLSDSGVCLDVPDELAENSEIGVSLFLTTDGIEDPDAEPLNIKARVIWTSPRDDFGFSSGLRFDHSDSSKEAIAAFLSQI